MGRYIEFEKDGNVIKLEYNRKAVVKLEEMGFDIQSIASKPMTAVEFLVYGGLMKNHPTIKWDTAMETADYLIEEYGLTNLMENLAELYKEVFQMEGKTGKKLEIKGVSPAK